MEVSIDVNDNGLEEYLNKIKKVLLLLLEQIKFCYIRIRYTNFKNISKPALGILISAFMIIVIVPVIGVIITNSFHPKNYHEALSGKYKFIEYHGKEASDLASSKGITEYSESAQSSAPLAQIINSPQNVETSIQGSDGRVMQVYNLLKSNSSPMASSAATFVSVADKYSLNWKLLVAIAGVESSYGEYVPVNANGSLSYNSFWIWSNR